MSGRPTDSASSAPLRNPELLGRTTSRLVLIDLQEKLLPHIPVSSSIIENCRRLLVGAATLGVPASGTEQYPAGLGPTVEPLRELLGELPEKVRFSATEALGWGTVTRSTDNRDQVVVAGVEAHVCVLQTVFDLLAAGWRVSVVADATGSRNKSDWQTALRRMADAGASVTCTESVLFEWCEAAGTDEFRTISRLVTGRA